MRAAYRLAALVLPVAGLAALWGWSDHQSRQGTDWLVPIEGYDPRDLLRGHYIEYNYAWPGIAEDQLRAAGQFCIRGTAPKVDALAVAEPGSACDHPVRTDYSSVYGQFGLQRGRLYVPQTQARELQDKLRDSQLRGFVLIRQRADGHITPRELRFEPREESGPDTAVPAEGIGT